MWAQLFSYAFLYSANDAMLAFLQRTQKSRWRILSLLELATGASGACHFCSEIDLPSLS